MNSYSYQITYLGTSEGEWVGEALGCSDGEAVAVRVGAALGPLVGIPVGLAEGLAVVVLENNNTREYSIALE